MWLINRTVTVFAYAFLAYCAGYSFTYHFHVVAHPFPLEFRESIIVLTTQLLLQGVNPFDLGVQPVYTNTYGFLYHFIVYPLALVVGNNFTAHRLVSALFLYLSCFLIVMILRKKGAPRYFSIYAFFILLVSYLYGVNPIARPDCLGIFIYIASMSCAWYFRFSLPSLCASAMLGILAFYTKPYFLLGALFTMSYAFLFVSKKKGLLGFVVLIIAFTLSALVVNEVFECYFNNVLFSHLGVREKGGGYFSYAFWQASYYFTYNSGLMAILIISLVQRLRQRTRESLHENPLPQAPCDFFLFCLLANLLAFFAVLGTHKHNWFLYLFQLTTPCLIIVVGGFLSQRQQYRSMFLAVLAINLGCLTFNWVGAQSALLLRASQGNWERAEALIGEHQHVLASSLLSLSLMEQGKEIYEGSLTSYFEDSAKRPKGLAGIYPPVGVIHDVTENHWERVRRLIAQRKFDLIVGSRQDIFVSKAAQDIEAHYRLHGSMPVDLIPLGQHVELSIWVPNTQRP